MKEAPLDLTELSLAGFVWCLDHWNKPDVAYECAFVLDDCAMAQGYAISSERSYLRWKECIEPIVKVWHEPILSRGFKPTEEHEAAEAEIKRIVAEYSEKILSEQEGERYR